MHCMICCWKINIKWITKWRRFSSKIRNWFRHWIGQSLNGIIHNQKPLHWKKAGKCMKLNINMSNNVSKVCAFFMNAHAMLCALIGQNQIFCYKFLLPIKLLLICFVSRKMQAVGRVWAEIDANSFKQRTGAPSQSSAKRTFHVSQDAKWWFEQQFEQIVGAV